MDDLTPEAIEFELSKIGYTLGREENEVVEFINEEEGNVLLLDYNLMRATKILKSEEFGEHNGNYQDFNAHEERVLKKYKFSTSEEDEALRGPYVIDDLPFTDDDYLYDDYYDGYDDDYLDDDYDIYEDD